MAQICIHIISIDTLTLALRSYVYGLVSTTQAVSTTQVDIQYRGMAAYQAVYSNNNHWEMQRVSSLLPLYQLPAKFH